MLSILLISIKSSPSDTSFRKISTALVKKGFTLQFCWSSSGLALLWKIFGLFAMAFILQYPSAFNFRSSMILPIFCLVFYTMNRKTILGSGKQGHLHWNTEIWDWQYYLHLQCDYIVRNVQSIKHISFTSLSFLPIIFQICILYQYFSSKSSSLSPHPR